MWTEELDELLDAEEECFSEWGSYYDDIKALAKHYINGFFKDKSFWCGGPIPQKMLNDPKYIDYMLNLDICNGMDCIYNTLGSDPTLDASDNDIKHVIGLFNTCARAGIPKQFSVGIILMYLELCEGCKLAA